MLRSISPCCIHLAPFPSAVHHRNDLLFLRGTIPIQEITERTVPRFPQISTIFSNPPLPQTLSLNQLKPRCVNRVTFIQISNKLSLIIVNYCAIVPLDIVAHLAFG